MATRRKTPVGQTTGRLGTAASIGVLLTVLARFVCGQEADSWWVVVGPQHHEDLAIRLAVDDLSATGAELGVTFRLADDGQDVDGNAILVGDAARNAMTARLLGDAARPLAEMPDPQGYRIVTLPYRTGKRIIVAGGSLVGDVHGLYWVWDRLRVFHGLPDIQVTRRPRLAVRVNLAWGRGAGGGRSTEALRRALRYSLNWVAGPPVLDLVPWDSEPERTRNEQTRKQARELIRYAHALHMNYFTFANELTYHPSLLTEFGAALAVDDPRLWRALEAKYQRLLTALPELDGVEICPDDLSGFWGNYRAFDLMHGADHLEWSYVRRYRTLVQTIHDVVVGQFGKTYFHFTWGLAAHEQHSSAEVFRQIFTADVPRKGLFLIPKVTAADRWWHQPYNPTFNQTPHDTLVAFEPMNYYESGRCHLFPTFSGQYFQAGLQTFLSPQGNHVRGAGYLAPSPAAAWDTYAAYSYVLYRLAWDPDEDVRQIAEDFCAIQFGRPAANKMAEIYLMTPVAYKYGLHIEPVSYGQFNSFVHMRVGTFPVEGYPVIDGGREHVEFLHRIYLRCKPWLDETVDDLDHGLAAARAMQAKFVDVKPLLADAETAQKLDQSIHMTRLLIKTNNLYVKTAFAYFRYRETRAPHHREALVRCQAELTRTRHEFMQAPGFGYALLGVEQLQRNVQQTLDDFDAATRTLEQAPTRSAIEAALAQQQQAYRRVLLEYGNRGVKFAHVCVKVDGRDLLVIRRKQYRIDHLRWDPAQVLTIDFYEELPRQAVTVVPQVIRSRPLHPFVLEQPCEKNDFSAAVYLHDKPGGQGVMEFDLYYLPLPPERLGVALPW